MDIPRKKIFGCIHFSKNFLKKEGKYFVCIKKLYTFASLKQKQPIGALVQLVRIPACHAGGHEFESRTHRTSEERQFAVSPFVFLSTT